LRTEAGEAPVWRNRSGLRPSAPISPGVASTSATISGRVRNERVQVKEKI